MKSILKANGLSCNYESKNPFIFDSNRNGDFLMFGFVNVSKYNGLFYRRKYNDNEFEVFKIISQIGLKALPKAVDVEYFPKRIYGNLDGDSNDEAEEAFQLFDLGLVYKVRNYSGMADVVLDMRKMYDFSTEGRIYSLRYHGDIIIVRYEKHMNDDPKSPIDYTLYVGFKFEGDIIKVDKWAPEFYNFDIDRGDLPDSFWTYTPFSFDIDNKADIIIAYGEDEEDVIEKINTIYDYYYTMLSDKKFGLYGSMYSNIYGKYDKDSNNRSRKKNVFSKIDKENLIAYWHARRTLSLLMTNDGIYAGIPWFHQFWTRDEAISFGGLISERKDLLYVKEKLMKYLSLIRKDGRIPNRYPNSDLGSADGAGWVFKRVGDLLSIEEAGVLFTYEEKLWIYHKLEESIKSLNKKYGENFIIKNGPLETWMDTKAEVDGIVDDRSGFRIEIQALMLNMYSLASRLAKVLEVEDVFLEDYNAMKMNVKKLFFFGNILADGKGDMTIRPNVFLAYYIYPDLLNKVEWESVFDNALKKLWCSWGGLSTIEKENPFYVSEHTGIDNKSYHRGDSWFFVNHIAAISMMMLNKRKYSKFIKAIIRASVLDILNRGIIGSNSEISSSSGLEARGCLAQAWSNSTFIELMHIQFMNKKWKKNF